MSVPRIVDVKPFVPCGPNGQHESIAFYEDVGFTRPWGGGEDAVCEFDTGAGHRFLLLEKYNKALAENLKIRIRVPIVDGWAQHLASKDLPSRCPLARVAEPTVAPWGRRILYVWDPAGVLLHFAELHAEADKQFFLDASSAYWPS